MTFLTLNGYTVRVAARQVPQRRLSRKGSKNRSYGGQLRDNSRGRRRVWSIRSVFESFDAAETLIGIVNGYGHLAYMSHGFDCNRTGLSPEVGSLADVTFDRSLVPLAGFEPGALLTDSANHIARYWAHLGQDWTLHWRESEDDLVTWHWHTIRSDGAAWVDGVRDDTQFPDFNGLIRLIVRFGSVSIQGLGSDPVGLAHVCMLPYRAADAVIEQWGVYTKPWGALPTIRMEGDITSKDSVFVQGEVTGSNYLQVGDRDNDFGRITNNSQIVEFLLEEREQAFSLDPDSELT